MSGAGRFSLPPATPEERKAALEHPGTPWRTWFYGSMLKVYLGVAFLVGDSWIAGGWLEPIAILGAATAVTGCVLTLAGALYGEFYVYQYLWAKPSGESSRSVRSEFRRSWYRPFEFGRWTEPGQRVRAGLAPYSEPDRAPGQPDPSEFF